MKLGAGGQEAASLLSPSTFTTDKASTMASHNTHKQRTARKFGAMALAGVLVLAGCAPAGRDEACNAVQSFSRNVGTGNINYVELAVLTSRLSDDLYAAAQQAGNQSLRNSIRYAAGAARDVTTVIRSRRSMDVVDLEINILIHALDDLRFLHC